MSASGASSAVGLQGCARCLCELSVSLLKEIQRRHIVEVLKRTAGVSKVTSLRGRQPCPATILALIAASVAMHFQALSMAGKSVSCLKKLARRTMWIDWKIKAFRCPQ